MKKVKMLLCLILALSMITSMLSMSASAATYYESATLTFALNDDANSYTVTECNQEVSGTVEIPATYNDLPVTRIGESAFNYCGGVDAIIIPDTIESIEQYAFKDCDSLESVYITDIAKWCDIDFVANDDACLLPEYRSNPLYHASKFYVNGDLVTDLVIPEGVTAVNDGAFYNISFNSITLPSTLVSIGQGAFYAEGISSVYVSDLSAFCQVDCVVTYSTTGAYLTSTPLSNGTVLYVNGELVDDLVIPEDVERIGSGLFYDAEFNSVTIPAGLKSVGEYAFLESKINKVFVDDFGAFCQIDFDCFSNSIGVSVSATPLNGAELYVDGELVTDVVIPDGVTKIGNGLFTGCTSIETVTIPDSVTKLGYDTFVECDNLERVVFGNGITTIASGVFDTMIGQYSDLSCIVVPQSINNISISVEDASSFRILYMGTEEQWDGVTLNKALSNATVHYNCVHEYKALDCVGGNRDVYTCSDGAGLTINRSGNETGLGHDFSAEWTIDIAATCATEGEKSRHCSRCEEKTDVTAIEKAEHFYDSAEAVWFPTCTEDGFIIPLCSACGTTGETEIYPAEGHDIGEWTQITEPGCESMGVEKGVCQNIDVNTGVPCDYTETRDTEALGHSYSLMSVIEPTCEDDGSEEYWCLNCGDSYYEAVTAYGHDYSENWTVDVAATCTESGSKSRHCTRCDDKTDVTEISATGHSLSEWTQTIAPTCEEDGEKHRTCVNTDCDYEETAVVEALGHDFATEWTIDVEQLGWNEGEKSHHCTGCDERTDVTVIPVNEVNGELLTYTLNSEGTAYTLSACDVTAEGAVFIHAEYEGLPVTAIGANAFSGCTGVTAVSIPETITTMGASAFKDCTGLKGVYITDLSAWLKIVFANSYSNPVRYAGKIYLNNNLITDLVIPEDITTIKAYAFLYCKSITSIVIPEGVTSIGNYAFNYCNFVEDLTIPGSLQTIGNSAFGYCKALEHITFNHGFDLNVFDFNKTTALKSVSLPCTVSEITESTVGYIDSVAIEGFTIYAPQSNTAVYSYATDNGIKFVAEDTCNWETIVEPAKCSFDGEQYEKCTYCGTIRNTVTLSATGHSFVNGRCSLCHIKESELIESPHPYSNSSTYNYTVSRPGATSITLVFSDDTATENNYDYIYIYDADGNVAGKYCGTALQGEVVTVSGDEVEIKLTTDSLQTGYGFRLVDVIAEFENCTHPETVTENAVAATCTESGMSGDVYCAYCNALISESAPTEPGHIYSEEWTIDKEPTYTEEGEKSRHCTRCDERTDITAISVNDFSELMYVVQQGGTCNGKVTYVVYLKEGVSIGGAVVNVEFDNQAITPVNDESGAYTVLDDYGDPVASISGVYECGLRYDSENIYSISYMNTSTLSYSADRPFMIITFAINESYSEAAVQIYCAEMHNGSKFNVSQSDEPVQMLSETAGITISEHIVSDWIVDEQATANGAGSQHNECTVCGETLETEVIPQLACDVPELVSLTQSENGIELVWNAVNGADTYNIYRRTESSDWELIMTVKGTVTLLIDGDVNNDTTYYYTLEAINEVGTSGYDETGLSITHHVHSYGDWVVTEPTCTEDGLRYKKCACSDVVSEVIEAPGHDYSDEWIVDVEATCTESGSESRHCSRCDAKTDERVIETAGSHDFVLESESTSHPHTKTYTCSACGETKSESEVLSSCLACNFNITAVDVSSYKITSYIGTSTNVVIPATYNNCAVTTIANGCFKGNTDIVSVEIPVGVTTIGSLAFMNCTSLQKVVIPATVTSIGANAFYSFTGSIYCTRDSYAHSYAVDNNIPYVIMDIGATENTTIDYENFLIFTTVHNCDDLNDMLYIPSTTLAIPVASYI